MVTPFTSKSNMETRCPRLRVLEEIVHVLVHDNRSTLGDY
jgi:hypothetical protein